MQGRLWRGYSSWGMHMKIRRIAENDEEVMLRKKVQNARRFFFPALYEVVIYDCKKYVGLGCIFRWNGSAPKSRRRAEA
jgi:hypothetical protein